MPGQARHDDLAKITKLRGSALGFHPFIVTPDLIRGPTSFLQRRRAEQPHTRIGIQDRRLHIAGPTDQLRAIADNVHWLTINSPDTGSHLHMEYYDGHPFLEPGSIPLVISYEGTGSTVTTPDA